MKTIDEGRETGDKRFFPCLLSVFAELLNYYLSSVKMTAMTLYLIRHAQADERGPKYPDDSKRPLVEKGFKQVKSLVKTFKALDIMIDQLFSSPYTRAAQTAEPLLPQLKKGRHIHYLDHLATDDYAQLLVDVKERITKNDKTIAFVGHEPYLGELAAYLLTGNKDKLKMTFKKAAWLELSGELEKSQMALETFVSASIYKNIK